MAAVTKSIDLPPHKEGFGTIIFRSQFLAKPKHPPSTTNLSGKTAIITGGNSGIGLQTCHSLLSLHLSHLILTVRTPTQGATTVAKLHQEFPHAKIEAWELEMGSYASVQSFAARVHSELSRLDIAILNAGIQPQSFGISKSTGHEVAIQVNYLSTWLLAILLLPELKLKSPPGISGRLTIVGSATCYNAKFENRHQKALLASFDEDGGISWNLAAVGERYSCSKLLGHLFLVKLVEYVDADDVVVNIVDPGMTGGSGLQRDAGAGMRAAGAVLNKIMARSLAAASSTYIDAAVIKGQESHGCFVMDWDIKPFVKLVYTSEGKQVIQRLWDETMKEFEFAGALHILEMLKR